MNLTMKKNDSYLMFLKRYNHINDEYYWQIRSGIIVNGEVLTAEHYSPSLYHGIGAMEKWFNKSLNDAKEAESSDMSWLPVIQSADERMALTKAERELQIDYGIVLYGLQTDDIWFALCGSEEDLSNGEWSMGEANQEISLALGGLKIRTAQQRKVWKEGITHSQNPRDENGRLIRSQLGTPRGESRIAEHHKRIAIHNEFLQTPEGVKWKKLINNRTLTPKNHNIE